MSSMSYAYSQPDCQVILKMPHTPAAEDGENTLFLKDLPADLHEHIVLRPKTIKTILYDEHKERERNPGHQYVLLSHIAATIVTSDIDRRRLIGQGTKIFYDQDLQKLILKLPSRPHEVAVSRINDLFSAYRSRLDMVDQLDPILAGYVFDPPYTKEPDSSWIPVFLPPGRSKKWPSVVLEIGYSESLRRLRVDAEWWLCRSQGDVKAVIILWINPRKPCLVVEQFRPELSTSALRDNGQQLRSYPRVISHRVQRLEITESQGNVLVTGAPLVIRFSDIFLRDARNQDESDLLISQRDLEAIAVAVWRNQEWPDFV